MANEIKEVEAGARINHPVFRDVYNTTFDKDVIVDIEIADDGTITGMCQTEKYGWLPVFYHCKKYCYDEDIPSLLENGSLKNGVLALDGGGEVKVLLEEGTPKYVIGPLKQYNPPCMCKDIFKVVHEGEEYYFVASAEKRLEGNVDYYGDTPLCGQETVVFWTHEYHYEHDYEEDPTLPDANYTIFYQCEFLKLGPMLYYFWKSTLVDYLRPESDPFHTGAGIGIYSYGAWAQEKEDILMAKAGEETCYAPEGAIYLWQLSEAINEEFDDIYDGWGVDLRDLKIYGQSEEEE